MQNMIFIVGLMLGACTSSESEREVSSRSPCTNSSECTSGQLCVENTCRAVECATSLDCEIEQFCNASYECAAGCQEDSDCFAGDSCNIETKECQSYGCRSTELDCNIGEFCDQTTAECYADTRGHCDRLCTWNDLSNGTFGGECATMDSGEGACTLSYSFSGYQQTGCTGGDLCIPNDWSDFDDSFDVSGVCTSVYFFMECDDMSEQEQCPNGFSCQRLLRSVDPVEYSDTAVCIGDCSYYLDNGYLQ